MTLTYIKKWLGMAYLKRTTCLDLAVQRSRPLASLIWNRVICIKVVALAFPWRCRRQGERKGDDL